MKPLHVAEAPPFKLEVFYEKGLHRFRLAIWRDGTCEMIQYVPATYEPVFGIDASDFQTIRDEAEAMCVELEAKP